MAPIIILSRQFEYFPARFRISTDTCAYSLDRVLLAVRALRAGENGHFFVFLHKIVVFPAGGRIQERLNDKVEPAHLFVRPALLLGRILIRMINFCDLFEGVLDRRSVGVTSYT